MRHDRQSPLATCSDAKAGGSSCHTCLRFMAYLSCMLAVPLVHTAGKGGCLKSPEHV